MNFNLFYNHISAIKKAALSGIDAHFEMAPIERKLILKQLKIPNNAKKSAVLAIFYPDDNNEVVFILTKRSSYNGTHSKQISFPGGKFEESDIDVKNTALRETEEEIGIKINNFQVIKKLSPVYIPPSNFIVSPFLAILNSKPSLKKNYEVDKILKIKLSELLSDKSLSKAYVKSSKNTQIEAPCFLLENHIVWGATAMMLNEIKLLIKRL